MELLHMRYFLALAETESVAKAAEQLHIAPSSLSGTVNKFEAELGVELFDPAGRGIRLNEAGQKLYQRLKPQVDAIDLTIKETIQRDDVGVLLGFQDAWNDMLVAFSANRPDILLRANYVRPHQAKPLLETNEYDFWITTTNIAECPGFFDARKLCDSSLMLAVPETHPLSQRVSVSLKELKNEEFLFPFSKYTTYEKYLDICRDAGGFEPKIVGCAPFMRRLKRVSRNEGITFVECNKKESNLFRGMTLLEISDLPPQASCYICSRKGHKLSSNAQVFLNFALRYYQQE